jgi:Protein of unknown function (DUF2950)
MQRMKQNIVSLNLPKWAVLAILLGACLASPAPSMAQQKGQKTFSSPEEAASAFAAAALINDEASMLDILGPEGKEIISSGDPVADTQNRANFSRRYQQMHRLVKEPDGTTVLYIGAENWPCPIPLVNKGNGWFYDTDAGKKEILYRRVGRNEMSAIKICEQLAAAEKEYYAAQHNEYAQKIFSDEGQHNGLYWKAAAGEPESPIGPEVAAARSQGYTRDSDSTHTPFRGYYFRILTRQGKNAPGGSKDYVVNGKMTEGFAFVAYPAAYRSSGVMTFIVGTDGVVYQKDLGRKTEAIADAMKQYNRDSSWEKAEPEPETAAAQK